MVATLQATLGHDEFLWGESQRKRGKSLETKAAKSCIICNEPHKHNNSFCSADCCKSYKGVKYA